MIGFVDNSVVFFSARSFSLSFSLFIRSLVPYSLFLLSFFIWSFDGDKIDWDNKRLFYFLVHVQAQIHEICIFECVHKCNSDTFFPLFLDGVFFLSLHCITQVFKAFVVQLNTKWLFRIWFCFFFVHFQSILSTRYKVAKIVYMKWYQHWK